MSKLHDELLSEIGPWENVDDNVESLMNAIADRIDACNGNRVKLSDLATILREDPKKVSGAVQTLARPVVVKEAEPVKEPAPKEPAKEPAFS